MIKKWNVIIWTLVSAWIIIWGCAPKIISPNTGVYHQGILYANSNRNVTAVYEAGLAAISNFEFRVIRKAKDRFYAEILSVSADGKNITVKIRKKNENRTDYKIIHESFKKEISFAIFTEMQKSLNVKGTQ